MKHVFLLFILLVGSFSCTDKQVAEKGPYLPNIDHPERVEIRKSLSDIPLNMSEICPNPAGRDCMHTYQLLVAQLMVLDLIPVPQSTLGATISPAKAIDQYKSFMAQYRGEPILSVFKQLYPRILLTKYGILNGTDYAQIDYFAQHLIEAKSYDHTTLTAALKKLKPHSTPNRFNAMRTSVLEATHQQKIHLETDIAELSDTTAAGRYGDAVTAKVFPKEIQAQLLARTKSDYATLIADLDALNRL